MLRRFVPADRDGYVEMNRDPGVRKYFPGLLTPEESSCEMTIIEQHWDKDQNRMLINGRIPVNSHGGSLSEGGTQGSGHLREAIHQLQRLAGTRQSEFPGARTIGHKLACRSG